MTTLGPQIAVLNEVPRGFVSRVFRERGRHSKDLSFS